jgi:hypothetical protein
MVDVPAMMRGEGGFEPIKTTEKNVGIFQCTLNQIKTTATACSEMGQKYGVKNINLSKKMSGPK